MACVSVRTGNLYVRATENVECTITPKQDDGSAVAVDLADFANPAITGGAQNSALTDNGNGEITFLATAPSIIGTFEIQGKIADDSVFTGSTKVSFIMVGTPTVKSELSCAGVVSNKKAVRQSEQTDCVVTVKDNAGVTTGLASDFMVVAVGGTPGSLSAAGDLATVTFSINAPSTTGTTFIITGQLNDGTDFEVPDQVMTVVGTPTTASLISCAGDVTKQLKVREGEKVNCVIAVKDDSGLTNAFATDFTTATVTGGTGETPVVTIDGADSAYQMKFSVDAPASAGTPFTIRGRLANNDAFLQSALSLTVGEMAIAHAGPM